MSWLSRIRNSFRADRLADELRNEAEFHLEQRAAALEAAGLSPEDSRLQASRRFGHPLAYREQSRDLRLFPWIESVMGDVRYGLRQMAGNTALTASAILSLGLAVGSVTAAFALIDAIMLRPLPVREPEKLISLSTPGGLRDSSPVEFFSYPMLRALREAGRGRVDLFGAGGNGLRDLRFDGADEFERAFTQFISGEAFASMGLRAHVGRLLTDSDDRPPGEKPVAVLSYSFWQRRFAGRPDAIGKSFVFRGRKLDIVGVMQKGFTGIEPGISTDIWMPLSMQEPSAFTQYNWAWFRIVGYLRDGQNREAVQDVLNAAYQTTRRENDRLPPNLPKEVKDSYNALTLGVHPAPAGPSEMRRVFAVPLWIVAGVVLLVLLIACANVCNLLLARAAARDRELALRVSIGAGGARLMQQMLVESGLFAFFSLASGALLGPAIVPVLVRMMSRADHPFNVDLRFDWRVAAFLFLLTILITLVLGLAPALRASGVRPADALRNAGSRISGSPLLFRTVLTAQVAFCFVALFGASLFVTSMHNLQNVNLGFEKKGVVLLEVTGPDLDKRPDKGAPIWRELQDQLRALPGVESVALSGWPLFSQSRWVSPIRVAGQPVDARSSLFMAVGSGFPELMRFHLLDGRFFSERETLTEPAPHIALVNEAFARKYFETPYAAGRQFERPVFGGSGADSYRIVGVIANAKYDSVRAAIEPTVYVPLGGGGSIAVAVRGADSSAAIGTLRQRVRKAGTGLLVSNVTTQERLVEDTMIPERLLSVLSAFFGVLAVVLAGIGLYGVLNYVTLQRTHEIGIRLALGARRFRVVRLVVKDAVLLSMAGTAAGAAAGVFLARFVRTLLFEVKPSDPRALLIPAGVLLLAVVLASALPTLRAVRIEPSRALRYE